MNPPASNTSHRQAWLSETFDRYERPLVSYARTILHGDLESARDAVQDTFVQLCRQGPEMESRVEAWLFRACRNRCLDMLKRSEIRMRSKVPSHEVLATIPDQLAVGPMEHDDQSEQKHLLQNLLMQLPARQQEVLALRLQQQLSYKQIAEVTGLSVSNVGVHLHEAIIGLRRRMLDRGGQSVNAT